MEKSLIIPVVNLNGTSRESLVEDHRKALDALKVAFDALSDIAPHGRDYQTTPPGPVTRPWFNIQHGRNNFGKCMMIL